MVQVARGVWCSGIMLTLGVRGRRFNPGQTPIFFLLYCTLLLAAHLLHVSPRSQSIYSSSGIVFRIRGGDKELLPPSIA